MTKIFIVLQLVCSLVLAVVVVIMVGNQQPLKEKLAAQVLKTNVATDLLAVSNNKIAQLSQQLNDAAKGQVAEVTKLNAQIDQLTNSINDLKNTNNALQQKNDTSANNIAQLTAAADALSRQLEAVRKENSTLAPENIRLIGVNADLARANQELETKLRLADVSIRKLQEQIHAMAEAAPTTGASTGAGEASTVSALSNPTPAQINGKISDVKDTPGQILLGLPLGTRDGVRKGTTFMVYRDSNYIADAVVETVTPDESVAAVNPSKVRAGETIKAGDLVLSGSGK